LPSERIFFSLPAQVVDADHMAVTLHMGHEGEESINFVRAVLPALLRWDDPLSPTHGFHRSMVICGVDAEDEATSALEALLEVGRWDSTK